MATCANVFVRLKPTEADAVIWKSKNSVVFDRGTVVEEYGFSGVFTEDNLSVFQALNDYSVQTRSKCLVENIYSGVNETLFAYGQTGSGKTHSIFGRDDGEPGLLHMFVQDLFAVKLETAGNAEIQLRCFEIYAESLIDLLDDNLGPQTEVFLKTARYRYQTVPVQDSNECLNYLFRAERERAVGTTTCNARSSRSHCVVQFDVVHKQGANMATKGTLTFVDLAGSERTGNERYGKKESKTRRDLNVSLAALVRLFRQLQLGELKETERRQSVLNKLIFDYVQPTCGIWLLFCVAQEKEYRDYTFSTLQLASDSRNIRLAQQKQTFMKVESGLIPLSARAEFYTDDDDLMDRFRVSLPTQRFDRPEECYKMPNGQLAQNVLCESLLSELDNNRNEGSTAVPSDEVSNEDYAHAFYRLERKYKELKFSRSSALDKMMEENEELRNDLHAERARANSLEGLIRSEQDFVLDTLDEINKFRGTW